jgi:hypothetical protein
MSPSTHAATSKRKNKKKEKKKKKKKKKKELHREDRLSSQLQQWPTAQTTTAPSAPSPSSTAL